MKCEITRMPQWINILGFRSQRIFSWVHRIPYALLCLYLSGCQIPTPPLEALPPVDPEHFSKIEIDRDLSGKSSLSESPSVQMLIEHVNCELYRAAHNHVIPSNLNSSAKLWRHLQNDNFVAAIDMTLTVTHNEGFNPSLAFITPLYSATASTFNRTISIGGQANLTQDRNFDVNYVIDMNQLLSDDDPGDPSSAENRCKNFSDSNLRSNQGFPIGLEGQLGLEEILANGLVTIQAASKYNLYGSSGPKYAADTGISSSEIAQRQLPSFSPPNNGETQYGFLYSLINPLSIMEFSAATAGAKAGGTAKKGGGALSAGASGGLTPTVSFSSTIDFNLVWGINGGPNWTLIHFKGPSGGGGGGGGSGAGGGASGAGGGGGSLLNFTRTTLDTLVVTFTPTCRNDLLRIAIPATAGDICLLKGKKLPTDIKNPNDKNNENLKLSIDSIHFNSFPLHDGLNAFSDNTATSIITFGGSDFNNLPKSGVVTWNTVYLNNTDPNTPSITLMGTISGVVSNPGGTNIVLTGKPSTDGNGNPIFEWDATISKDIASQFDVEAKTRDYWASIPGCSTISAGAQQSVVSSAQNQNLLLRLLRPPVR